MSRYRVSDTQARTLVGVIVLIALSIVQGGPSSSMPWVCTDPIAKAIYYKSVCVWGRTASATE
eukprot:1200207-Amphidinium_carterae.1